MKLPQLKIEPFGGDIIEWKSFFDSFKSAVDESSLSEVEKFNYLRGYLRDDALSMISGMALTGDNYTKALAMLSERYGNTDAIISIHMKELVALQPVTSNEDLGGLRRLYDSLETHIRSLLSLNVDTASYGMLLKPLLMEKLPREVKLLLTRGLRDTNWDLTKLQTALKDELLTRETCLNFENDLNPRGDLVTAASLKQAIG